MTDYHYSPHVQGEIERMIRDAIPQRVKLRQADLRDDYGGIDAYYIVNGQCPLQIRARFNRPAYAPDEDVTLRSTEPAMITAGTYAPLWLVIWFRDNYAVAGKLIDVYRMAEQVSPPLGQRQVISNGDGTGFLVVSIPELHQSRALLRNGDRHSWAANCLDGNERIERIMDRWTEVAA